MKDGVCPKCSGRELYVIDEAQTPDYSSANIVEPATLTASYGSTGEKGWLGDKIRRSVVRFEARICAACSYTEIYAKDLDVLAMFAAEDRGNVRKLG